MTASCDRTTSGPYLRILAGLNRETRSDDRVSMISQVDMSSARRLRARLECTTGVRPSYTAIVAKAISEALQRAPYANRIRVGFPWRRRLIELDDVDLSVAVERDQPGCKEAVFVGTIRSSAAKNLGALTRELQQFARATPEAWAHWGSFKWIVEKLPTWLAKLVAAAPKWFASLWIEHRGGAAILSSPARYGVDIVSGTWPWPLGFSFGHVKDRPWVVDGRVLVRPTMYLKLSFDRHLLAGASAARLFAAVCRFLEGAETCLVRNENVILLPKEHFAFNARERVAGPGGSGPVSEVAAFPIGPEQLSAESGDSDQPRQN